MKCPFRINEKGEFMDCYGKECMAYYEYIPYVFESETTNPVDSTLQSTPLCRKMAVAPVYTGCT